MTEWRSGIDGGAWVWCPTCKSSTPPTDKGTCATCGHQIVPKAETKKKDAA